MKFSFSLIKQLVPAFRNKKEFLEKLNLSSFEAENLKGDVFDVSLPPNRYGDAASHWGIAREASATIGKKLNYPLPKPQILKKNSKIFGVKIEDRNSCPRYQAGYFSDVKVGQSPKWMQKILIDCGLRPINNIVDIMNYVMLETGQPLHAFDYDKLESTKSGFKQIIIRKAREGEKITTLDEKRYSLNKNTLVIADEKKAIAIAGIKGGKDTEIDKKTTKILVEAANFESSGIYGSSKILRLTTDASSRFSRGISPVLTEIGLDRASELLKATTVAKPGEMLDVNFTKPQKKIIKFDLGQLNSFIGLDLNFQSVKKYLECLGFKIRMSADQINNPKSFLVEVPALRLDVENFEDLTEEVSRLHGYNVLKPQIPKIHLVPSGFEDQIVLKDKIRKVLVNLGFSEVYNYSFLSEEDLGVGIKEAIELENPVSAQFRYLRPSLAPYLLKNTNANFRFFNNLKIFEIGKVFYKQSGKYIEKLFLGIAIGSKDKETFFELKGTIPTLFKKIGLVDFLTPGFNSEDKITVKHDYLEKEKILRIESDSILIGYLGGVTSKFTHGYLSLGEIDLEKLLKLVAGEHEFRPLSKYPSVMRDISIIIPFASRVGQIMQAIQEVNKKYIDDVDLIDEYKDSYTFRIVFQADDRTLTDKEVNKEMLKIEKILKEKFKVSIR